MRDRRARSSATRPIHDAGAIPQPTTISREPLTQSGPGSGMGRHFSGAGFVNDSNLAKLVVTVIVLISFTVWMAAERRQSHACKFNCATDFSASRK
jgi:hypothetical protein